VGIIFVYHIHIGHVIDGYVACYRTERTGHMTADIDRLLPLTPAVYHILLALVDGERHGYGIIKAVQAATDGKMRFGTGTLYRSLDYMLEVQLITEGVVRPDPAVNANAPRRHFRLTALGAQVFSAETERIGQLVRAGEAARARLGMPRPTLAFTARAGGEA